MITTLDRLSAGQGYDVVVIGAGAAGLAAALFAAIRGHTALVIESTSLIGGTSALSAGTTWVPNTHHAARVGAEDSPEQAARFLAGVVGNHGDRAMLNAFLASGPEAIATLEAHSDVTFRPYALHPDYEQDVAGATLKGRALEPVPFDGRRLGRALGRIRPPIPEFTIFGGMMVDRTDIGHLLGLTRSARSFAHAARLLARYGGDRVRGSKRGSRLVMGNALVGRLLASLLARGVAVVTDTQVREIERDDDGALAAVVATSGGAPRRIAVGRAVVLATGGFSHHPERRADLLGPVAPGWSPTAPGSTGDMQDLALRLGARLGAGGLDHAFWAPVSLRRRPDGSMAVFPHFVLDRSKPGTLCVDQTGARFVNEATSYHRFARAMREAAPDRPATPCFLIADAVALKRYGLGMVRMGTTNLAPYLADGYLTEAASATDLAVRLGLDAATFATSLAAIDEAARSGHDPAFGRGSTAYHRVNGDAAHDGPNPTLGRLATPPFYAVRLWPADIGAATGLVVDPWARVIGADGTPMTGLYACGNEAQSIMGGTYPAPGITLGPALTFAYRAMQHALGGEQG